MRQLVATLPLLVSYLASGQVAREMPRACEEVEGRRWCDVILLQGGIAYAASGWQSGTTTVYRTLGTYRGDLQPLVSAQEVPVNDISFRSGGRVIVAWGYGTPPRLTRLAFRLYFYSSQGSLEMKVEGDNLLERLEGGDLFGSSVDLLLLTMRGESGPSVISKVWRIEDTKEPEVILSVHGSIKGVENPRDGSAPGLWIEYVVLGEGGSTDRWIKGFWEWVPQSKRFRGPGSLE